MDNVIVVGAGPVGLWLAGELRLAGVPVTVLERQRERRPYTRGLGVHARTLEVLAMRGVAETPLAGGRALPRWHFGMLSALADFSGLPTDYPYVLAYPQNQLEDLLERRAVELGATVLRGHTVTGLTQDATSVRVTTDGPDVLEAGWVVGCDGTDSTVRRAAGIAFPGTDATLYGYLGDVALDNPPEHGAVTVSSPDGALIVAPLPGGRFRVTGVDPHDQDPAPPMTVERLRRSALRAAGRDLGIRDATWLSRFGNATRQAEAYRAGRVLVAGDAAHMHLPAGGVGLNIGVQDAMNLGWKLAAVARGRAADALLDTYHAERHPVGAALLEITLAQTALIAAFTPEGLALRKVLSGLIDRHPALSADLALSLSGLDVGYPPADRDAHPLTGTRAGDSTLFPLLAGARPVLVRFTGTHRGPIEEAAAMGALVQDSTPWPGHEKVAYALIRPDGYVWCATDEPDEEAAGTALAALGVTFGTRSGGPASTGSPPSRPGI